MEEPERFTKHRQLANNRHWFHLGFFAFHYAVAGLGFYINDLFLAFLNVALGSWQLGIWYTMSARHELDKTIDHLIEQYRTLANLSVENRKLAMEVVEKMKQLKERLNTK